MKGICTVFAVFVLTGCALTQPTDPYEPAGMSAPVSAANLPRASASSLPDGPVSLRQAIAIGLANNPEIAALGWEESAAAARRDQAFAQRLPSLGARGSYYHHVDEQRILPVRQPQEPAILSRDIVSSDLVFSIPLFTSGRLVNRVQAADLLQKAASHELARSRKSLIFNISSLYYSILAQQHAIESAKFSEQALTAQLERTKALIEAKKAAKVDRLRTEVRMSDVRQQLVAEKNRLDIYHRTLANLFGLPGQADQLLLAGELELRENFSAPAFATALAEARENRDDYRSARLALEARARNVDAARAEYWPEVFLMGTYGGRWAAGSSTGTGDTFGDEGRFGVEVEMPIFDSGRINAEIREQRAELAAARKRLRALELDIRLEIETALADIASFRERAAALEKSIVQARESLRIEQQRYDLGKGTIVDVLDAQDALLGAETTYYEVLAELRTAMARLKLATGEI